MGYALNFWGWCSTGVRWFCFVWFCGFGWFRCGLLVFHGLGRFAGGFSGLSGWAVVLGVLFILLVDLCLLVFDGIGLLGFNGAADFSPPLEG